MKVSFLLNGEPAEAEGPPTRTLLDWLREERGLRGTKEGCNEGDCGACTVMVTDARGPRALNACILFLPQLAGSAVRTVEGIASPAGELHPVQQALVDHHGSQCGFCTPGFVMALYGLWMTHENPDVVQIETALQGNLCRCTGYEPIVRAALAAGHIGTLGGDCPEPLSGPFSVRRPSLTARPTSRGPSTAARTSAGPGPESSQMEPRAPAAQLRR